MRGFARLGDIAKTEIACIPYPSRRTICIERHYVRSKAILNFFPKPDRTDLEILVEPYNQLSSESLMTIANCIVIISIDSGKTIKLSS